MKLIRLAVLSFAILAILLSGIGCQEKTSTPGSNGGVVGSIQIVTGAANDTLSYLPNDSASTNVTIIVTDDQGLAMPGQKVDISLLDADLGVIEFVDDALEDSTNSLGRVNCVFRVYNESGNQLISATTGGKTAQRNLVIRELEGSINAVTMFVTPENLEASELAEDSAQIDITITDISNRGVPNVALNLSATGGRLVIPPATDSTGRTTTWWYNNREFGDFLIVVRAGTIRDTANVNVIRVPRELGTLVVTSDVRQIEADGCISAATISASLKNVFGESVVGDTVRFGTPRNGASQTIAITDSLGVARVNFCGMYIPDDQDPSDSSLVVARYERWGIRDTVNVRIIPAAGIGTVNLGVSNTVGTAGVDSAALNVFVQFANGQAVNGYYVKFLATQCGDFKYDSLRLHNGRPDSTNYFYMCRAIPSTPVELTAEVDGVFSDPVQILITPGAPSRILLYPIAVTGINEPVEVTACVSDTFNNPVGSGTSVGFLSSVGSIASYVSTNPEGCAITMLNPGTTADVGLVRAFLASGTDTAITTITVTAGDVNSLTITLNPSSLLAQGSGGQDWSQIEARVFDTNGNPVIDGTWVRFRIESGPNGVNINSVGNLDSAQTAGGLAVATLNAGTGVGAVRVSGCATVGVAESCVPATGSVVSGPPAEIGLGVDELGDDFGGAAWDVEINALVKDAVQNNVINGTAVFFEVSPANLAQILSESVVVGNPNKDGDSHSGIAFTTMRYNSLVTNGEVVITARTANGIVETMDFVLPIQEAQLTLNCLPGSWHFGQNANGNPCHIQLQAIVRDGHQVLINNQEVYYVTARGRMYANFNGTGQAISIDHTGPAFGEPNGYCSIFLVDSASFIFPDPITPEIPGEVRAEVVGYPDGTDSQVINFRR